ncbi:hypothetical protein LTR37_001513 [Vermiconidia calcicola]|uniref:Uncharacterized protein n=1 Tax=Vermiconidia calcicola TaxID=1690605 RepID=A0ACC3NWQ0_9PEZI|nr:hypothetical protein LTR37_001513 [Vermiconidia calcicola]
MVLRPSSWQGEPWQSENRWGRSDLPPFIPYTIDHDKDWRASSTAGSSYSSWFPHRSSSSYSSWVAHSSSSTTGIVTSGKNHQHTTPWQTQTYPSSQWLPMPSMVAEDRSTSTIPTQSAAPTEILATKNGIDKDILVAAIVVPILAILTGILLAFFFLRRRSLKNSRTASALTNEKVDSSSMRDSPPPSAFPLPRIAVAAPPIVTSQQNNTYNTGLDTWSSSSRSQSMREGGDYAPRLSSGSAWVEPPPPYSVPPRSLPPSFFDAREEGVEVDWEGRSPFEDPPITTRSGSFSASLRSSDPFASPSNEAPSPISMIIIVIGYLCE